MGAWGEGPFDNDSAADWFFGLDKTGLYPFIERGLNSEFYEEVRAAAWLLSQIGYNYVYNYDLRKYHINLAINKLEKILADEKWINTWSSQTEIEKSLRVQIKDLKELV